MTNLFQRILCPIDLSENSLASVQLASQVARETDSTLVFLHVAPDWLPEEAMLGEEYRQQVVVEDQHVFDGVRPSSPDVPFEHQILRGNAGPVIVQQAETCDMVIMSTHGHSGLARLLLGSVAQYVLRRARCPVILVRIPEFRRRAENESEKPRSYVTHWMRQVDPVQKHDKIDGVLGDLRRARQTAAPVVDIEGTCSGILTATDIDRYRQLRERYEQGDESVVEQMFKVDQYGQRRPENSDFDQVGRHMTQPVITIGNHEPIEAADRLFEVHSGIHHLVVVDDQGHPVGMIDLADRVAASQTPDDPSDSLADSSS